MQKKYLIGELSKRTGLSVYTLRYYDSIDLLKPDYIDEHTGYRYYDAKAFWNVEIIKLFRALDIPLEKLCRIVNSKDNEKIYKILGQKKSEAKLMVKKYKQMIEDMEWLQESLHEMESCYDENIYEENRDAVKVIYMENAREERELHLTLQDISIDEMKHLDKLKRKYGYVIGLKIIYNNVFFRKGEYVNLYTNKYKYTNPNNIYTIPAGRYVCKVVEVKNHLVDMSSIRKYLKERNYEAEMIFAEEIGLPMFDFEKYKCELQILVKSNKDSAANL